MYSLKREKTPKVTSKYYLKKSEEQHNKKQVEGRNY